MLGSLKLTNYLAHPTGSDFLVGKIPRVFPTADLCSPFAHPTDLTFWWAKFLEFSLQLICAHLLPTLQDLNSKF
ncbi:hypothetical protein BI334_31535 [Moorena producens 3L]|nr:hypothetical protein BI334_31535 [Moorena producens 3L]